jgi:ATP-dependent DNA helicase DinG
MRDTAELLGEKLRGEGFDILAPRRATDDPSALVERFVRSGGILLGARTFWQGLDIPGPALQAVVIEKLPFEVPTELRKRREARIKQAGRDAFDRYTLGKMLLNLKQMTGRLIRSEEDRGIVVIVEGRSDKRYFKKLAQACRQAASGDRQAERSGTAARRGRIDVAAPDAAARWVLA